MLLASARDQGDKVSLRQDADQDLSQHGIVPGRVIDSYDLNVRSREMKSVGPVVVSAH